MASRGSPFDPLKLTDEEEQRCYDHAFQLLDRTLRSYDERGGQDKRGRVHHSKLDGSRWKLLKTQANASLYVDCDTSIHEDTGIFPEDWENPAIFLMVGTIQGSLHDIMLGLKALDANSISFRTEMPGNHPIDSAVLTELLRPTEVDPFRFLGITWLMFEQSRLLKAVMRPRDLLMVTSTGTMTRSNGDQFGYEVVQPARLPQCPPLSGTMRDQAMYAAIFKQQEPGIVDVYIPTYVPTHGVIYDKVIVSVTWKATLRFWDAPELAEMKKLQWSVANCRSERQKQQKASSATVRDCRRCSGRLSKMKRFSGAGVGPSDMNFCILCGLSLCSKCRVERTLKVPDEKSGRLKDSRVAVCLPCVVFVRQLQPRDIAICSREQRAFAAASSKHNTFII